MEQCVFTRQGSRWVLYVSFSREAGDWAQYVCVRGFTDFKACSTCVCPSSRRPLDSHSEIPINVKANSALHFISLASWKDTHAYPLSMTRGKLYLYSVTESPFVQCGKRRLPVCIFVGIRDKARDHGDIILVRSLLISYVQVARRRDLQIPREVLKSGPCTFPTCQNRLIACRWINTTDLRSGELVHVQVFA